MIYSFKVYGVHPNHEKTRVWKGEDRLWCVTLNGAFETFAKFGSWEKAVEYATTGRIRY